MALAATQWREWHGLDVLESCGMSYRVIVIVPLSMALTIFTKIAFKGRHGAHNHNRLFEQKV